MFGIDDPHNEIILGGSSSPEPEEERPSFKNGKVLYKLISMLLCMFNRMSF